MIIWRCQYVGKTATWPYAKRCEASADQMVTDPGDGETLEVCDEHAEGLRSEGWVTAPPLI